MIILEDKSDAQYQINSYTSNEIVVNNKTYTDSLILSANQLISDWPPQSLDELKISHLEVILQLNPKIVLLATGNHFRIPASEITNFFQERSIGIECMNIGAVCRTYTALIAEGRKIVAAFLMK